MGITDTRVRSPHPPTNRDVTPEELLLNQQWGRCELIDGKVIQMSPAGHSHGKIAARLLGLVWQHVTKHSMGEIYTAETGFIYPDGKTVRAPDVMFVSTARIPADLPPDGYLTVAPDFAVEVVSFNDRLSNMLKKAESFIAAGVKLAWVVDPESQSVHVYKPDQPVRTFKTGETLSGDDILPGFTISVDAIFKR
jgi:Uma2 family endonuclease